MTFLNGGEKLSDDVESRVCFPREGLGTQARGLAPGRKEEDVRES